MMNVLEQPMPMVKFEASASSPISSEMPVEMPYDPVRFVPVVTLVLWLVCLAVGVIGIYLPYGRPQPAQPSLAPIEAEMLHVELTHDPMLNWQPPLPASVSPLEPPALLKPEQVPPAPAPTPVAEPSSSVAFALPVEGPTRIVETKHAAFAKPVAPIEAAPTAAPVPQPLIYGQGAGKQPAPDYPRQAMRAGQEGTVLVRFAVGQDGRVLTAEPSGPSRWPLLNESATRTVRDRWRFSPGAPRLYEVAIRFQLRK